MKSSVIAILLVLLLGTTQASQITIGPMGINSANLKKFGGVTPLTGAGIGIGQVEPHRPGDADAGDDADHRIQQSTQRLFSTEMALPIPMRMMENLMVRGWQE